MSRRTVWNRLVNDELLAKINIQNKELKQDFLDYLESVDRSEQTVYQYSKDLDSFFVWNLQSNDNKFFVDIKKRDYIKWQKWAMDILGWSPARLKRVKATLSSLSNYIERILDDEYPNFRSVITKIESPIKEPVREKTVLTDEQIKELLDRLTAEERYEQACAVAILAYSGMRKAELLLMKTSYFTESNIIFDGAMYQTEKIRTKGRGKNGKQLNKYVLIAAKPYIDKWLSVRPEFDNDWMFVNAHGERRKDISTFTAHWSKLLSEDIYAHSFRHYFTSYLSRMNIPAEVIREINGWSEIGMVSVYNDNEVKDTFGMYFTKDGVVKQNNGEL